MFKYVHTCKFWQCGARLRQELSYNKMGSTMTRRPTSEMDAGDWDSRLIPRYTQEQRSLQITQVEAFILTQVNKNALVDALLPEHSVFALTLSIIIWSLHICLHGDKKYLYTCVMTVEINRTVNAFSELSNVTWEPKKLHYD